MPLEQNNTSANNKRIAKNTLYLYLRMFISMAVSLYTARVILQTLGAENYGINNIVGGTVAMFSFLNVTMSTATSRFLTFEIGKGNQSKLNDTFNAAFWVHVILALIVIVLCESIGLWFLNYKMVLPESRVFAAHVVFQLSILSTAISITQVPYNASIIAHEKMDIYAYVEMVNVFLRLGILYLLVVIDFDKLILYGILTFTISASIMMFYRIYGNHHFEECKIRLKWSPEIVKPMLTFSGWDFYGNMSVTARTQGVSMLLNVFFGPLMNAAAGIATQVQNAVMSFASSVNTASRPQIIKYYAAGEYKNMESLINNTCRFTFLILAMLTVPLCSEINYVLSLWLKDVPQMTAIFCVLTLLFNLFTNLAGIVVIGIHAYGKVLRPCVINGTLYLLVVPISYVAFKLGGNAWTSYFFNLCAVILGMLSNAYTLHKYIPEYSLSNFLWNVLLRCLLILIIGFVAAYAVTFFISESFIRLVLTTITTSVTMGVVGWFYMVSMSQRATITANIKRRLRKV